MPNPTSRTFEPRKQPQQERSRRMRTRIVEASIRVLRDEGALGFTTTRVADEAGVSVGSLYQYFPNKHALILAIHNDAVQHGWDHVQCVLDDPSLTPRQKLIGIAKWFFATESSEAVEMGAVFEDIDVFLRDHGEDRLEAEALRRFAEFVAVAGSRDHTHTEFDAQLLMTTLEAVGKAIASRPLSPEEREQWATATAMMLCSHLGIRD